MRLGCRLAMILCPKMRLKKAKSSVSLSASALAVGAVFLFGAAKAEADTIFGVSGTFADGSILSGTITIGTAESGFTDILGGDLFVDPIEGTDVEFNSLQDPGFSIDSGTIWYDAQFDPSGCADPGLDCFVLGLVFPLSPPNLADLSGYTGGPLCVAFDSSGNCPYNGFDFATYWEGYSVSGDDTSPYLTEYLVSGSLNARASITPEPATFLLLGASVVFWIGIGWVVRRKTASPLRRTTITN
jgi:hypothetical protein